MTTTSSEQASPSEFCVENEKLYANLAHVAQDILVLLASLTSVESFSKAWYAPSGRKNQLANTNLENEILLKTNKQYLQSNTTYIKFN